jgi:hypothetical protein
MRIRLKGVVSLARQENYNLEFCLKYFLIYLYFIHFLFSQGILILQEKFKAIIQYSHSKDTDGQHEKILTDWYCNCGGFNFKRRENCFKCGASRVESENGGEGSDEVSNILTKSMFELEKTL